MRSFTSTAFTWQDCCCSQSSAPAQTLFAHQTIQLPASIASMYVGSRSACRRPMYSAETQDAVAANDIVCHRTVVQQFECSAFAAALHGSCASCRLSSPVMQAYSSTTAQTCLHLRTRTLRYGARAALLAVATCSSSCRNTGHLQLVWHMQWTIQSACFVLVLVLPAQWAAAASA